MFRVTKILILSFLIASFYSTYVLASFERKPFLYITEIIGKPKKKRIPEQPYKSHKLLNKLCECTWEGGGVFLVHKNKYSSA